ncbi:hypothetical protein RBU49_17000 [Clostridium sp. MB40-C1]|uniref:hypothetical protein n=1 Tax=Clostridium sp. MB40-C1 TaxID=3070996 RepID=UPI0027E1ADC8|nr:hypothetical protein [Clostridium sp. MB40-C1]WMJ80481.1 hypothetical protein RBU49_17000 [Clostridium sp. MB40-C1]
MKKIKGFTIIAIISSIMMFVLTGCGSSDKTKLIDALNKGKNVKYAAFESKIDFGVEGAENGKYPVKNMSLEVNGKTSKESDKNQKLEANIKASISGVNVETKFFEEITNENGKVNVNAMIQIPEFLKAQIGPAFKDVDYLNIDTRSLEDLEKMSKQVQAPTLKMDSLANNPYKLQEEMYKEITAYLEKDGDKIIENKGKQEISINNVKETVEVYNVKMSKEELNKVVSLAMSNDKNVKAEDVKKGIDEFLKLLDETATYMEIGLKDGHIVHTKVNVSLKEKQEKVNVSVTMNMFDIDKKIDIKVPTNKEVKSKNLLELVTMMANQ